MRAKVFARGADLLLAIGTVIVPITYRAYLPLSVTAVDAALAGLAQVWLGVALLRSPQCRAA